MPLNAPNLLTVGRILLVPVLVVALLADTRTGDVIGAVAFAVGAATDALDGYLARSSGEETKFGKLAEPLADKLLVAAALVLLVAQDTLPLWVAVVIIVREVVVTVLRTGASRRGVVAPAQPLGKAKTVCQVAMVLAVMLVVGSPLWLDVLIDVTVALTVVSGADFVLGLRRRWAGRPSPAAPS
ncbi:MAG TPA: CDP-diacylglycerol--glycerol-3-phosphate 3-phosphatidyltransferase [Solirubrobacteraceae bacterium]